MKEKSEEVMNRLCNQIVEAMSNISEEGIHIGNVDYLGKIIDIKKDIANIKYWKEKEDIMRTSYDRDSYGARMRDSRGRYMEGSYRPNYRGERIIDDMYSGYRTYSEGKDLYGRGNYGGGDRENNLENLSYMLQSVVDFMAMLKQDAGSEEEVDLIKRYAKTLSDM